MILSMSKEFAEKLKKAFGDDLHGGQTRLAKWMDVTPQTVQQWMSGKTEPRRTKYKQIADFFNTTVQELFFYDEINNSDLNIENNKQVIDVSDMSLEKFNALEMIAKKIKGMRDEEVPDAVLGFNATTNALEDRRRKESNKGNEGNTDKN